MCIRDRLSGPRFGATLVPARARAELAEKGIEVNGVMSQFGWQFERLFLSGDGQMAAVSEFVVLVGGLDQGTFLPSINWGIGARHVGGLEFGVGPNLSAAGSALVIAAGATRQSGSMNIPVNVGGSTFGQADIAVEVLPGQTTEVYYSAPMDARKPGRIGLTPQAPYSTKAIRAFTGVTIGIVGVIALAVIVGFLSLIHI